MLRRPALAAALLIAASLPARAQTPPSAPSAAASAAPVSGEPPASAPSSAAPAPSPPATSPVEPPLAPPPPASAGSPPGSHGASSAALPPDDAESARKERRKLKDRLALAGAVTFGIGWGVGLVEGLAHATALFVGGLFAENIAPARGPLLTLIPLVGPFVTIPVVGSDGAYTAFLVIDGVVQSAGVVILLVNLAIPTNPVPSTPTKAARGGFSLGVQPIVGPGRAGLALTGTF